GKYEILARLSVGGMAELFLAFTSGPGGFRKFVAVKQILPDIKKDPQFVKMFLDEARITAGLSHANIGQVFDLGQEDGELYLAMEFISGQNLEQVAKVCAKREKPVPVGFSTMVLRDTCLGLHYAHAFLEPNGKPAPVIHRDVSPKNVMVTYQGNVKVIDFGIAKAKGRLGRTQVGIVKGTSGYMSPEQVRGEALDGRSDLFAAGVMLYELLTEQRLFTAPNDASMMMKIVDGEIPEPRKLNPKVPQPISEVVMKALQCPREERFATGKEMAKAIEAAMGGELFDEDQAAALMRELFEDRVNKTRALLDVATQSNDAEQLESVAGELREDEPSLKSPTVRQKPVKTPPKRASDAPLIKPRPLDEPTPATPAPPPRGKGGAQRYASSVAKDYALYHGSDADTVQDPQRRSRNDEPSVQEELRDPTEEVSISVNAQAARRPTDEVSISVNEQARRPTHEVPVQATSVRRRIPRREGAAEGGGWGGKAFGILLVLVIGGLGVSTRTGPLQPYVRPVYDRAAKWFQEQTAGEPPVPDPMPILQRHVLPPQAVSLIERQKAEAEEAKARAEAAARTPDPPPPPPAPPPPVEPPKDLKEKRKVAQPARQPGKKGPGSSANTPLTQRAEGEAEVLDTRTAGGAAKDGLGWLSLFTVPPAQVFDGANNLGVSPLVKVPLPAGTYRLRLVDPEGQNRMLSAKIKPGEVSTMKISVGDLPLEN
ncbi:MAG TPA: serine/threonine-protein kinase, partial [Myxococcaceae bacterium]|nr:serine/threonine-protein kinase [Myxococcaceae bacterium]